MKRLAFILAVMLACAMSRAASMKLARVPEGGLQPQIAVAADRTVHLIYLTGKPNAAEVNYVRSTDGGATWSSPVRVSNADAPAIATGTIRGPHVAVGGNGTVHVAWMASPKAFMYARLAKDADKFDTPRNVVTQHPGLDGGGSVAAADDGRDYLAWHAPADKPDGDEDSRRVYLIASTDDGHTFSSERAIFDRPTGACGCCGMRLFARGKHVWCIYRGAADSTHRGLFLLASHDHGETFAGAELAPMTLGVCLMSTANFAPVGRSDALVAWETLGQVSFGRVTPDGVRVHPKTDAPDDVKNQKHPTLVVSPNREEILLTWTEGMKFGHGGQLVWQVYNNNGEPEPDGYGRVDGVPAHSLPAAFCNGQGEFTILY
jgi:hypothetical protein